MHEPIPSPSRELVRLARQLERAMARRRKLREKLAGVEAEIKRDRSLIAQLSQAPELPTDADVGPIAP